MQYTALITPNAEINWKVNKNQERWVIEVIKEADSNRGVLAWTYPYIFHKQRNRFWGKGGFIELRFLKYITKLQFGGGIGSVNILIRTDLGWVPLSTFNISSSSYITELRPAAKFQFTHFCPTHPIFLSDESGDLPMSFTSD